MNVNQRHRLGFSASGVSMKLFNREHLSQRNARYRKLVTNGKRGEPGSVSSRTLRVSVSFVKRKRPSADAARLTWTLFLVKRSSWKEETFGLSRVRGHETRAQQARVERRSLRCQRSGMRVRVDFEFRKCDFCRVFCENDRDHLFGNGSVIDQAQVFMGRG